MAVKGVVMDYRKWRRGDKEAPAADDEEAIVKDDEPVKLTQLLFDGDWSEDKVRDLAKADPLLVMENGDASGGAHQDTGIRE